MSRPGGRTAADQVVRMLALVPFISRRPGISIDELAAEFEVSADQIMADLNLLMVCGEPGYYPGELIEVILDEDGGTVSITYDAGLERPVRLAPEEAVTLIAALRTLEDLPGLVDTTAVRSALAKLERAGTGPLPAVEITPTAPASALTEVRAALEGSRRIHLTYYTASRDELTEREVDPLRLLLIDGHSYLEGYCYLAGAVRLFRLDRIEHVRLLRVPAQTPLWSEDSIPPSLFSAAPDSITATLLLEPAARWVAEYYHLIRAAELPDRPGVVAATIPAGSDEWFVRLVLSLGGAATIADRPDLSDRVVDRARQALTAYDADPPPH